MKVTPNMLDESLRNMYWPMKLTAVLLSHEWTLKLFNKPAIKSRGANIDGLHCAEQLIPSQNGGPDIRVRIFKPLDATEPLPGLLYLHGGGYTIGTPEFYLDIVQKFIKAKPCVIIAPDYRKALEAPYPAAFNDCYDTLLWMRDNSDALGIVPDKFIVGGHSAGGGLTAAVTLKARDTKDVAIAFQMPIYPMIDDRQTSDSASNSNAPLWNTKTNNLGWQLYLKDLQQKQMEIPAYAAPARATDYSKLPPTITFVGDLEPFRDETVAYVENLKQAGVSVEFELFKGCFHGFETVFPEAEISQLAWRYLLNTFSNFVDRYFS